MKLAGFLSGYESERNVSSDANWLNHFSRIDAIEYLRHQTGDLRM
jgi:hypothetical protein